MITSARSTALSRIERSEEHPLRRPRGRRRHHRRRGGTRCGGLLSRTALVERDDFASGTSSKSSKLVHGIRYREEGWRSSTRPGVARVARLLKNAHLVRVLPFIPILSKDGLINRKLARPGGPCGCTTSPAACASKDPQAAAARQGVRVHADVAVGPPGQRLPLLRRPRRRRPSDAHDRPHGGHRPARSCSTERRSPVSTRRTGRSPAQPSTPTASRSESTPTW